MRSYSDIMKKGEFRHRSVFNRYQELVEEDVQRIFANRDSFIKVNCPGCGGKNYEPQFEKLGASMPKVSVVIPTYQYADFIGDAIDSVLAQTYKDYELIVVDGKSTDGTRDVVARYGDRVRYILQESKGVAAARNLGILASKGEYIAFLDADNLWLPDKLELQVRLLDENPTIGLVFSDWTFFDERGATGKRGFQLVQPLSGHVFKNLFIEREWFIEVSTVVVRRKCFEKVGFFDESLMSCEDDDMWLRITRLFKVDYIDVPLAKSRLHPRQMSHVTERILRDQIAVQKKTLESNPFLLSESNRRTLNRCYYVLYKNLGRLFLATGKSKQAREQFKYYIRLYPYGLAAYIFLAATFLPPRVTLWLLRWKKKLIRT